MYCQKLIKKIREEEQGIELYLLNYRNAKIANLYYTPT